MARLREVAGRTASSARPCLSFLRYPAYPNPQVSFDDARLAIHSVLIRIHFPGQLLRGATDDKGDQKTAALLVGLKLDLEAEVHLTARVKGDVCVGLY